MQVKWSKRLIAYIVDVTIIGIFVFLISSVFIDTNELAKLSQQLNEINERIVVGGSTFNEDVHKYAEIVKQIDLENIVVHISSLILILIYFVVIPYINNGITIGLSLFKLKIKTIDDSYLSIRKLMLRSFIINGLLYLSLSLALLYVLSAYKYFIIISILGFIQLTLVCISSFMILYRRDRKGLQDIISKTRIIKEVNSDGIK